MSSLYNWQRDYDPSVGRNISADQIGQNRGVNIVALIGYWVAAATPPDKEGISS